jgi:predicted membrane channel-forming protein YqfA (hemolysin III family)
VVVLIKSTIKNIASNKYAHLFLGIVVLCSGVFEAYETIEEDIESLSLKGHHGVIILGAWQMFRAIAEIIESFDYLYESEKS